MRAGHPRACALSVRLSALDRPHAQHRKAASPSRSRTASASGYARLGSRPSRCVSVPSSSSPRCTVARTSRRRRRSPGRTPSARRPRRSAGPRGARGEAGELGFGGKHSARRRAARRGSSTSAKKRPACSVSSSSDTVPGARAASSITARTSVQGPTATRSPPAARASRAVESTSTRTSARSAAGIVRRSGAPSRTTPRDRSSSSDAALGCPRAVQSTAHAGAAPREAAGPAHEVQVGRSAVGEPVVGAQGEPLPRAAAVPPLGRVEAVAGHVVGGGGVERVALAQGRAVGRVGEDRLAGEGGPRGARRVAPERRDADDTGVDARLARPAGHGALERRVERGADGRPAPASRTAGPDRARPPGAPSRAGGARTSRCTVVSGTRRRHARRARQRRSGAWGPDGRAGASAALPRLRGEGRRDADVEDVGALEGFVGGGGGAAAADFVEGGATASRVVGCPPRAWRLGAARSAADGRDPPCRSSFFVGPPCNCNASWPVTKDLFPYVVIADACTEWLYHYYRKGSSSLIGLPGLPDCGLHQRRSHPHLPLSSPPRVAVPTLRAMLAPARRARRRPRSRPDRAALACVACVVLPALMMHFNVLALRAPPVPVPGFRPDPPRSSVAPRASEALADRPRPPPARLPLIAHATVCPGQQRSGPLPRGPPRSPRARRSGARPARRLALVRRGACAPSSRTRPRRTCAALRARRLGAPVGRREDFVALVTPDIPHVRVALECGGLRVRPWRSAGVLVWRPARVHDGGGAGQAVGRHGDQAAALAARRVRPRGLPRRRRRRRRRRSTALCTPTGPPTPSTGTLGAGRRGERVGNFRNSARRASRRGLQLLQRGRHVPAGPRRLRRAHGAGQGRTPLHLHRKRNGGVTIVDCTEQGLLNVWWRKRLGRWPRKFFTARPDVYEAYARGDPRPLNAAPGTSVGRPGPEAAGEAPGSGRSPGRPAPARRRGRRTRGGSTGAGLVGAAWGPRPSWPRTPTRSPRRSRAGATWCTGSRPAAPSRGPSGPRADPGAAPILCRRNDAARRAGRRGGPRRRLCADAARRRGELPGRGPDGRRPAHHARRVHEGALPVLRAVARASAFLQGFLTRGGDAAAQALSTERRCWRTTGRSTGRPSCVVGARGGPDPVPGRAAPRRERLVPPSGGHRRAARRGRRRSRAARRPTRPAPRIRPRRRSRASPTKARGPHRAGPHRDGRRRPRGRGVDRRRADGAGARAAARGACLDAGAGAGGDAGERGGGGAGASDGRPPGRCRTRRRGPLFGSRRSGARAA